MTDTANRSTYIFDARGVAKRFRHAAIFGALEALGEGETMRFVNDHDPLPLLQQIQQRYRDQVQIQYVMREPSQIVIDFVITLPESVSTESQSGEQAGGCGSTGGGCGCSGG